MAKVVLFSDGEVGQEIAAYICKFYPNDLLAMVIMEDNPDIIQLTNENGVKCAIIKADELHRKSTIEYLTELSADYFILAWWPKILPKELFSIPLCGTINTHPSYLPYNRGKHYNFWTIVEDSPFGVSLHFIDEGIDTGDILFQKVIEKDWTDTGKTLYYKAQEAMLTLFCESYPKIRAHEYNCVKQNPSLGSFHLAKELSNAATLVLDKLYTARELLNLLRAKTFPPYRGAHFFEDGQGYEIEIKIKKINNESN